MVRLVAFACVVLVLGSACKRHEDESDESDPPPLANAPASNDGPAIRVPSDSKARYFVVEKGGTAAEPTLVTKRVGPSGASYSRRLFNCRKRTFKYLGGDADTLEELATLTADPNMGPLVAGSISDYWWHYVCDK